MNRYEPRTPRALAGLAAVCMTAATLALSVMAPATIDSDVAVAATSTGIDDHAYTNAGPLTTSIDVVAYRTQRVVPVVQSRAQLRTGAAS